MTWRWGLQTRYTILASIIKDLIVLQYQNLSLIEAKSKHLSIAKSFFCLLFVGDSFQHSFLVRIAGVAAVLGRVIIQRRATAILLTKVA